MKRNKQAEKFKEWRRRINKYSELRNEPRIKEWIPVDEPQFIGWQLTVKLKPYAYLRSDAAVITAFLNYFCRPSRAVVLKNPRKVAIIRRNNKDYRRSNMAIYKEFSKNSQYNISTDIDHFLGIYDFAKIKLSEWSFKALPDVIKEFFYTHYDNFTDWTGRAATRKYYSLNWSPGNPMRRSIPYQDLQYKLTKVYSYWRGIPNSEVISETDKMESENLWRFYCSKHGYRSRRRYTKHWIRVIDRKARRAVKAALQKSLQMDIDDAEILIHKAENRSFDT